MKNELLKASRYIKYHAFEDLYLNLSKSYLSDNREMRKEFTDISNNWDKKIEDYKISLYEEFINNLKAEYVQKIYDFLIGDKKPCYKEILDYYGPIYSEIGSLLRIGKNTKLDKESKDRFYHELAYNNLKDTIIAGLWAKGQFGHSTEVIEKEIEYLHSKFKLYRKTNTDKTREEILQRIIFEYVMNVKSIF